MTVIEAARELGKAIQSDERYKLFVEAKERNKADDELNQMIFELNTIQDRYQEQQSADSPDKAVLDECDRDFRNTYSKIMVNENMRNYENVKRDIDDMMNTVMVLLQMCVNGADPETCDPSAVPSCSGNCSGCSGC